MPKVTGLICTLLMVALPATAESDDYQGLWSMVSGESKSIQRIELKQRGSTIYASWSDHHSSWKYSVKARQTEPNTFSGRLSLNPMVPDLDRNPDNPAIHPLLRLPPKPQLLGTVVFVFTDGNNGSLTSGEITYRLSRLPRT
jgi:hypothetical protein